MILTIEGGKQKFHIWIFNVKSTPFLVRTYHIQDHQSSPNFSKRLACKTKYYSSLIKIRLHLKPSLCSSANYSNPNPIIVIPPLPHAPETLRNYPTPAIQDLLNYQLIFWRKLPSCAFHSLCFTRHATITLLWDDRTMTIL